MEKVIPHSGAKDRKCTGTDTEKSGMIIFITKDLTKHQLTLVWHDRECLQCLIIHMAAAAACALLSLLSSVIVNTNLYHYQWANVWIQHFTVEQLSSGTFVTFCPVSIHPFPISSCVIPGRGSQFLLYEPVTKGRDLQWDTLPQNQTPNKLFSILPLESGVSSNYFHHQKMVLIQVCAVWGQNWGQVRCGCL